MERTRITIGLSLTYNLGNYSNARPSIEIEAALNAGEDVEAAKARLRDECRAYVEGVIDDALEADGQRARFSADPRYKVLASTVVTVGDWNNRVKHAPPERLVVIVPDSAQALQPPSARGWWRTMEDGMRLGHAQRVAARYLDANPGYRLLDEAPLSIAQLPLWATELVPEPAPAAAAILEDQELAGEYEDAYEHEDEDEEERA
jgi:hypothetical protein